MLTGERRPAMERGGWPAERRISKLYMHENGIAACSTWLERVSNIFPQSFPNVINQSCWREKKAREKVEEEEEWRERGEHVRGTDERGRN